MMTQTIEIRPKVKRNVILLGIGSALFVCGGLFLVFSGESVFVGCFSIVFFGGGALYSIPKILRRPVTLVLTPEGIEQRYPQGSAYIPWTDVEKVGIVTQFANKMVGIRLKSYDRYLDRMSPSLAEFVSKTLPYLKLMSRAGSLLDVPLHLDVWSKLQGHDASEVIKSFGKVGNLAEALLWSRNRFGYDFMITRSELDRSAENFVALLEEYRASNVAS